MDGEESAAYSRSYYEGGRKGSERSAAKIVPTLLDLLSPRSVIDVGCGLGTWLRAFCLNGVHDVCGIDGTYVPKEDLSIDPQYVRFEDISQHFVVERTFDLAISLEVAEHLPASRAAGFIEDLVRLSPAIVFSAAIPGQGGTNHINEQWPDYWVSLFGKHGYVVIDCLRDRFWDDEEIEFWYRQNILLFVCKDLIAKKPDFAIGPNVAKARRLVHPGMHLTSIARMRQITRQNS